MKNFPFKAINPDTGKEQEFWYSRSMAVALFVFAPAFRRKFFKPTTWFRKQKWYVLANLRGPGCPDYVNCWVCPCGYLDHDETLKQAAARECKEETGVKIPAKNIVFAGINDSISANRQNVTVRFYAILDGTVPTSNSENEEEETSDIRWIPIEDLDNYKWAFDHDETIQHIFTNHLPNV